jgi:hypothetical protein
LLARGHRTELLINADRVNAVIRALRSPRRSRRAALEGGGAVL